MDKARGLRMLAVVGRVDKDIALGNCVTLHFPHCIYQRQSYSNCVLSSPGILQSCSMQDPGEGKAMRFSGYPTTGTKLLLLSGIHI